MGSESTSVSIRGDGNQKNDQTQVLLNVYDLTPINNYMSWFGFGIFHSGIEVHGKEYGFGAHDFAASGVFEVEPRTCPGYTYRCCVPLGYSDMPPSEFRAYIENAASEYHGDTYNLISKNCNHFSDDMSWRLTGKRIPGWVNRLARLGSLCSCLLPESLQVTTVKQPEYHEVSEDDGIESLSPTSSRGSTEIEDDQDKQLLKSAAESRDVVFVQESHRDETKTNWS